jgi:hypothetical protein
MHWLESDGCCKAVVIETSFFVVWRFFHHDQSAFSPGQDPHPVPGLLLGAAVGHFDSFRNEKI